ncbi:hypothetical protein Q3G72_002579 [Acer saccharum]|nr:hypothetical protein Q3G72_002579 [Acer saccharum]
MDEKIEQPISDQRENMDQQQLQLHSPKRRRKGGMITMPFIIANEAFEKVASYGLVSNMILYLMREYHIGAAKGSNILFVWSAATNFMLTLGAIIGDSYLGKFLAIGLGSIFSFMKPGSAASLLPAEPFLMLRFSISANRSTVLIAGLGFVCSIP